MTTESFAVLTAEHYPKTHVLWGDDGLCRINELIDKAVFLVNRKKPSSQVVYAGLSEDKSKPNSKPVVFVDCESFERYYINERHITNSELPKAVKVSAFK